MKAVINHSLPFGLLVPVVNRFDQRLTFVLHSEIYNRRRPTMRRSDRASVEIVGRLCATEWKLHVRVRVNASGDEKFSTGINHAVSFHVELRAYDRDGFIFNQHVGSVIIGGSDDATVTDKCFHLYALGFRRFFDLQSVFEAAAERFGKAATSCYE